MCKILQKEAPASAHDSQLTTVKLEPLHPLEGIVGVFCVRIPDKRISPGNAGPVVPERCSGEGGGEGKVRVRVKVRVSVRVRVKVRVRVRVPLLP